jgi:hypothetical protein
MGAAAIAGTSVAGCSAGPRTTISSASAGHQVAAQLTARYHPSALAVTCPAGVPARAGQKFSCSATIDGQAVRMEAVVTSGSGAFTVTPADAIFAAPAVIAQLEAEIAGQTGQRPTISCPGPGVLVVPVGATFSCSASFPGEAPRAVTIRAANSKGDFGYQLAPAG